MKPLKVGIIGCGAISELYYAPAIAALAQRDKIEVKVLVDPTPERLDKLAAAFPLATKRATIEGLGGDDLDLAIIASPPRFHASQCNALVERGIHVLCEKPMAGTVAEAEAMIACAKKHDRKLAVGLFRRFFPTSEAIREFIFQKHLGSIRQLRWSEGGPFNWPAASPSFFQKSGSNGGVLADHGVHCLDLLLWWLGDTVSVRYEDDAMGGLEANCRAALTFAGDVKAVLRLSRDTAVPNYLELQFERGWVRLEGVKATDLLVGYHGSSFVHRVHLDQSSDSATSGSDVVSPVAARSYEQSFMAQIQDLCEAIRLGREPRCTGEEGARSMRLIEQCYRERELMQLPWMTELKSEQAMSKLS